MQIDGPSVPNPAAANRISPPDSGEKRGEPLICKKI